MIIIIIAIIIAIIIIEVTYKLDANLKVIIK